MEVTINPVSAEEYVTYGATEFTYDGHEIKIVFENTNSTSIKQFLREEQNIFLNIKI